jgi:ferritin-like metal-binding protein YciE
MASTIQDIYLTGLRNAHAVEAQAIQLLGRQVERLEHYPALAERMRVHIDESRAQQQRLEQILDRLGTSHSALKDMMSGLMGTMAAFAHAVTPDEVVKNGLANFAFEHFEIASYLALLEMADAAGDGQAPALLRQSLEEERRMAAWIEEHLPETVRTYMRRETSGRTAGV